MATKTKKKAKPIKKLARKPKRPISIEMSLLLSRLIESHSELTIRGNLFPSKLQVNFELKTAEPVREGDVFRLAFRVSAAVIATSDENSESRLSIIASWEVHYGVKKEPTAEESQIVGYSAAHFAWPFLREFVSSVAQKMGASRVSLPLLRIDEKDGVVLVPPPPASA